jgi:ABC-2 type transport system permease protein
VEARAQPAAPGAPVAPPPVAATRSTSEWRHFLYVTAALTSTEFKLRYFGSVLGYLWTLLRPLMLFGVLYVVFTHIVRFGGAVSHYPVVLLGGIVLFNFFSEATSGGLGSLVARENLLRKVAFPRAAVPVAVSLTAAANLALGLVVVFGFALVDGVTPSPTWILYLVAVVAVIALAMSLSVLLAVLYVRYRDVQPIWEVALQLFFWGTPIIYTIESVPDSFRELLMFSPLGVAIQQSRHWLVHSSTESAAQAIGGAGLLAIPLAIFVGTIAVSVIVFRRAEGRMAEDL